MHWWLSEDAITQAVSGRKFIGWINSGSFNNAFNIDHCNVCSSNSEKGNQGNFEGPFIKTDITSFIRIWFFITERKGSSETRWPSKKKSWHKSLSELCGKCTWFLMVLPKDLLLSPRTLATTNETDRAQKLKVFHFRSILHHETYRLISRS